MLVLFISVLILAWDTFERKGIEQEIKNEIGECTTRILRN